MSKNSLILVLQKNKRIRFMYGCIDYLRQKSPLHILVADLRILACHIHPQSNFLPRFRSLTSNLFSDSLNVSLHLPQASIHKVIICLLHTRHICILNFFSKQLHHKTIGIHQEVNQSHSEYSIFVSPWLDIVFYDDDFLK